MDSSIVSVGMLSIIGMEISASVSINMLISPSSIGPINRLISLSSKGADSSTVPKLDMLISLGFIGIDRSIDAPMDKHIPLISRGSDIEIDVIGMLISLSSIVKDVATVKLFVISFVGLSVGV